MVFVNKIDFSDLEFMRSNVDAVSCSVLTLSIPSNNMHVLFWAIKHFL